jgi:UDP-N-acetylglucosamine acyltransferase
VTQIHSTAVVEPGAVLGVDVTVGPFCVVEAGAVLGDGCRLDARAVIKSGVTLGKQNEVGEGTVIGGKAQHVVDKNRGGEIVIGDGNRIRENVTIHRGFADGALTRVGDNNLIMVGAHIGHDCRVGNNVILVNNCLLGGHVEVQDRAYLGGAVAVHQFCRIGRYVMVGGMARVTRDIPPFVLVDGHATEVCGLNKVGLKRNGFSSEQLLQLKEAYRVIYRMGLRWTEVLESLSQNFTAGPASEFLPFFQSGKRGFVQERRISRQASLKIANHSTDAADDRDDDRARSVA